MRDEEEKPVDLRFENWQGPNWPVWPYVVVKPGDGPWAIAAPGEDWAWSGGLFRPAHSWRSPANPPAPTPDGRWPRMYRPLERATELFKAAVGVDTESVDDLLGFVNAWGTLGVGTGRTADTLRLLSRPSSRSKFDTVWATKRALDFIQRHYRWLQALQKGQYRSADLPGAIYLDDGALLETARACLPPHERDSLTVIEVRAAGSFGGEDPYLASFAQGEARTWWARNRVRPTERDAACWQAFGTAISHHLRSVHPTLVYSRHGGPAASWRARRPIDVLWTTLYDYATKAARIVTCKGCRRPFLRERRGKEYCTPECANRASSRSQYQRKVAGRRRRKTNRPRLSR